LNQLPQGGQHDRNGGSGWLKYPNDGIIDSYEQNPEYSYQDTGYYSVKLSITGEEIIEDYGIRYDYIHVTNFTGIDYVTSGNKEVIIYPNPTIDILKIVLNNDLKNTCITIYNSTGKLIKTCNTAKYLHSDNIISVSMSDIPTGVYFLKVESLNNSKIKKIVVIH